MRVSYNDEIPVSSLAACVFHMPLLGIPGFSAVPVCFCVAPARVKSRLVLLYNLKCLSPSSRLLFNSMLSAVRITSGIGYL